MWPAGISACPKRFEGLYLQPRGRKFNGTAGASGAAALRDPLRKAGLRRQGRRRKNCFFGFWLSLLYFVGMIILVESFGLCLGASPKILQSPRKLSRVACLFTNGFSWVGASAICDRKVHGTSFGLL